MSVSNGPEPRPERDEARPGPAEHAYFQAIEEAFIALRGAPLLLSPADYRVAADWHARGVPLDLVRATLDEVFAARRRREAKGNVSSLRYCAPAVEKAWEEARELAASAHRDEQPAPDLGARLDALATALDAAGVAEKLARSFAERIRALEGSSPEVETALAALDDELCAAASAALGEAERQALAAELDAALGALAARLPDEELARARARLERQLLRRRLRLPVLSLFSPEAEA